MSYLVLARKYRPLRFSELVGQELAKSTLRGAIEEGRVAHAYLFAGPHGTGKTTVARILAKALLCEQGPAPEPCGECSHCADIDRGVDPDVIEFDAASHTGVEYVRELREQVGLAPMRGRFKVYIVDEVHMLSKSSFNAFLKTLEEPPPHVKFLFATTEQHKVPDTVQSRCQVVRMSLLSCQQIEATLADILAREGVEPGEGVTSALARAAQGSMRDALSLTDQLLALVGEAPTVEDLERLGGAASGTRAEALVELVLKGEAAGLLAALEEVTGRESEVLSEILELLRSAMLAAVAPSHAVLAASPPEEVERLAALARRIGAERLRGWLEELLVVHERIQRSGVRHASLVLETALLELCHGDAVLPVSEIARRLTALEARLEGAFPPPPAPPGPSAAPPPGPVPGTGSGSPPAPKAGARTAPETAPVPTPAPAPESDPGAGRAPRRSPGPRSDRPRGAAETWQAALRTLEATHASLADLLRQRGRLVDLSGGEARIVLSRLTETDRVLVGDPANQAACRRAFSEVAGREVEVTLEDAAARPSGRGDDFTRQVLELFDGQIDDER